ncbi:MAG: glycosyl hydrolase [Planctomycetaceae bacterium]|nr:glycosyl hydrolase [Planctomycetaceae bacterium]
MHLARAISLLLIAASVAVAQQVQPTRDGEMDAGFEPIFDGRTLAGWDGDPVYWRVADGCLVGEVTPETILQQNSFIIWRGGSVRDFELKLEYRISPAGNSGVNYRSAPYPQTGEYALRGYQADIDGANRYTGQNYEEKGRTFLALRGDVARVDADGVARIIGAVGDKDLLAAELTSERFHQLHIIARGNSLVHMINGRVMSIVVDDDPRGRAAEGLIGVQVHVGPPMKVEYRNIRLKRLADGAAVGQQVD